MADVTFEGEVAAWNSFCKKDGINDVPVSRSDVEAHMKGRFVSPTTGEPISQEELDLIFDYTCDACEAYISIELIGKHGWDLAMCEAFLTGKRAGGSKIRYCAETVKTSILNLKFASQFDSLSRPKSQGIPNIAHLTMTNPAISPPGHRTSSTFDSPPAHSSAFMSQSSPSLPLSTVPIPSSLATTPFRTPSAVQSPFSPPPPSSTHPNPRVHASHVSITTPGSRSSLDTPTSHHPLPERAAQMPPPIPPKPHRPHHTPESLMISGSAPANTVHSAPNAHITEAHNGHGLPYSTQQLRDPRHQNHASSASMPTTPQTSSHSHAHTHAHVHSDGISPRSHTAPTLDNGVSKASKRSTGTMDQDSMTFGARRTSSSGLVDGQSGGHQACTKIFQQGFCSPRECPDRHAPHSTICKWLTTEGFCKTHGCAFRHPNLVTRESIATPIFKRLSADKSLTLTEWDALRLRMVFDCPIEMKDKKCGKGSECRVLNCPKQHKKPSKDGLSPKSTQITIAGAVPSMVMVSSPSASSTSSITPSSQGSIISSASSSSASLGVLPLSTMAPALPPRPAMKLKDVTSQANHMNLVTSIMLGGCAKSAKPLKIRKLEEISNPALDEQYRSYFLATHQAKGLRPSEIYAFHGAPAASIQAIASNGFDMSKIKRTKFGHGLYCALDANVSVDYCGDGNKMLLVRLITDGLKWVKDPAYYVIQDAASMNPLYIITFDKT